MNAFAVAICVGLTSFVFGAIVAAPLLARAVGGNSFRVGDDSSSMLLMPLVAVPPFALFIYIVVIIAVSMEWTLGVFDMYNKMAAAVVER